MAFSIRLSPCEQKSSPSSLPPRHPIVRYARYRPKFSLFGIRLKTRPMRSTSFANKQNAYCPLLLRTLLLLFALRERSHTESTRGGRRPQLTTISSTMLKLRGTSIPYTNKAQASCPCTKTNWNGPPRPLRGTSLSLASVPLTRRRYRQRHRHRQRHSELLQSLLPSVGSTG